MPYWQLFYHLVWATKERQPFLTPQVAPIIYGFMRSKAVGLEGTVYAINGIDEHVHMVVAIPPKVAVSKFVGQVKGVASARYNKLKRDATQFAWQAEYGAFTFDRKRLPYVIDYVERQQEHHRQKTIIPVLERTRENPIVQTGETSTDYNAGILAWHQEMLALESP